MKNCEISTCIETFCNVRYFNFSANGYTRVGNNFVPVVRPNFCTIITYSYNIVTYTGSVCGSVTK
jgi:hypothetical protein